MTAIAGLVDNGKVYIGGDSAGTSGWHVTTRADEKVFPRIRMTFGIAGSFRVGQLVRYSLDIPSDHNKLGQNMDPMTYLVGPFVNSLRECLKKAGELKTEDGKESMAGTLMVGYLGNLYVIEGDFQVGRPADGLHGIGSGGEFVIGSLATSTGDPIDRVRKALEIAGRYSANVCEPYYVI